MSPPRGTTQPPYCTCWYAFFWHAGTPVIRASHPFVVLSFSQISHLWMSLDGYSDFATSELLLRKFLEEDRDKKSLSWIGCNHFGRHDQIVAKRTMAGGPQKDEIKQRPLLTGFWVSCPCSICIFRNVIVVYNQMMSSISDPLDLRSESDFMFWMNSLAGAVRQMFSIEEKRSIVHLINTSTNEKAQREQEIWSLNFFNSKDQEKTMKYCLGERWKTQYKSKQDAICQGTTVCEIKTSNSQGFLVPAHYHTC